MCSAALCDVGESVREGESVCETFPHKLSDREAWRFEWLELTEPSEVVVKL